MSNAGEARLLKADIDELDVEIYKLQQKKLPLQKRLAELEFGVKIGDEVEYKGIKGKIAGFCSYWPQMYPYKKDGTLGSQLKHCYNWEENLKKL